MADFIVWFGSDDEHEAFKESPSIDEPDEDTIFATPDISNVDAELVDLMKVALGVLIILMLAVIWAWRKYGHDIEKFHRAVNGGGGLREFAVQHEAELQAEHWGDLISGSNSTREGGGTGTGGNTPTVALSPVLNSAHVPVPKSPVAGSGMAPIVENRKSLTPKEKNKSPPQPPLTLPGGSLANRTMVDNETDLSLTTDRASSVRHRNVQGAGGDTNRSLGR